MDEHARMNGKPSDLMGRYPLVVEGGDLVKLRRLLFMKVLHQIAPRHG
jgi:hypothetical protein